MGKGGMSHDGAPENQDGGEENMAAWLVGINTLKIQPFKLPPLGVASFFTFLIYLCFCLLSSEDCFLLYFASICVSEHSSVALLFQSFYCSIAKSVCF